MADSEFVISPNSETLFVKMDLIKTHQDSKGIPQGTPISALLSNIYMVDFDLKAKEIIDRLGGKYYRYCDDMLFITQPENQPIIEHLLILQ